MRNWRSTVLLATFVVSGSALAQDIFIDNPTYKKFHLDGVPNFDQRRENAAVTIGGSSYFALGLANNGSEFCCPTSAIEWTDFLANRGWPSLAPGPGPMTGDYTGGVTGLGEYDSVDLSIVVMAVDMHTSGTNGTYGGPAQTGAQQFFDSVYPGYFNTINIERDSSGFPHMRDMLDASLGGNLVEIYGGWYNTLPWFDTTVYWRNGGHCVALSEATWNNNPSLNIGICNPWTYDGLTVQSPQGYSPFTTTNANVFFTQVDSSHNIVPGTQTYENVDFIDKSSNWILDGALEIQPLQGYTIENGWLYYLYPLRLVNKALSTAGNLVPPYIAFKSPDGTPITNATRNPLTGHFDLLTQGGAIYGFDPVSQVATPMQTKRKFRRIMFGGSLMPMVWTHEGEFAMWDPVTDRLSNRLQLGKVDGVLYDQVHDSYYWYKWGRGKERSWIGEIAMIPGTSWFSLLPAVQLPAVQLNGDSPDAISAQIDGSGHLLVFQTGDPVLYDFSLDFDLAGRSSLVTHQLPAVQRSVSFAADDMNRLYFSLDGKVVVTDINGGRLDSPFADLPAGTGMEMSHSVSNYRPWIQGTPFWNNRVPSDAFRGSKPN